MDDEKKEELSELEKAKKLLGEAQPAIAKYAKEMGFDLGLEDGFIEDIPAPKFRLVRKSRVGDIVEAERMAREHFNTKKDSNFKVTPAMLMQAKICILGVFGEEKDHYNLLQLGELGEDFFTVVSATYSKYLAF